MQEACVGLALYCGLHKQIAPIWEGKSWMTAVLELTGKNYGLQIVKMSFIIKRGKDELSAKMK